MTRLLFALLALLPGVAAAQLEDALERAGLVEIATPDVMRWNRGEDGVFSVTLDADGGLRIEHQDDDMPDRVTTTVDAGPFRYEGSNRGEWGGELVVTDADGRSRTLIEDNIVAIHRQDDTLLVFTGLSHMISSRGAIWRIHSPETDPRAERITLLPDAPTAIVVDPQHANMPRIYILGASALMSLAKFGGDDDLEVHMVGQSWATLYPDSFVLYDGHLVFGMRGGIGVVDVPGLATRSTARYFAFPSSAANEEDPS